MPEHQLLDGQTQAARPTRAGLREQPLQEALAQSLVLVHGGMAQNVGPILNMVTSKYLLRGHDEWLARQEALRIFDQVCSAGRGGRRPCAGRVDNAELEWSAQGDHPLGQQCVHRGDHRRGAKAARRGLLGFPDAGRHVRGRDGVFRRSSSP